MKVERIRQIADKMWLPVFWNSPLLEIYVDSVLCILQFETLLLHRVSLHLL